MESRLADLARQQDAAIAADQRRRRELDESVSEVGLPIPLERIRVWKAMNMTSFWDSDCISVHALLARRCATCI